MISKESEQVLSYLGGLFDGEGNASLFFVKPRMSSPKRFASGRKMIPGQWVPAMQVKMTDEAPVRLLHDVFGGSFSIHEIKSGKQVYYWRVSHRKAEGAARILMPYVLIKGPQLQKVLDYYSGDGPRIDYDPSKFLDN